MKPTENTFFFLFKRVRAQAPHPIEKVESLESLEKPENQQCGLFDLFDLFDRVVSVSNIEGGGGEIFKAPPTRTEWVVEFFGAGVLGMGGGRKSMPALTTTAPLLLLAQMGNWHGGI